MEWERSSDNRKWQEVPSLDHHDSVDVEASYRFSDHWDILNNLYERFGFTVDSTAQITQEQPVSNREWADCQKWIGYHKSTSLPSNQITSVHQFLSSLVANEWNLSFLEGIAEHDIAINATFPLDQHREDAFSILPNKLNDGSLCYVIDNNDPSISNQWSLVLTDPVTVLQCMRMNFNGSLKNMARYLFYSGIKFNTCILRDPPENDDLSYRPLSLGWRPSEYESKPTTGDYGEYHATLDCLFSRPYTRAALLEGGIIWHIALCYLGDCELNVTRGPSLDTVSLGKRWTLQGGSVMYNDQLSESEKDVICGVYKIATGKFSSLLVTLILGVTILLQVWDYRLYTCPGGQSKVFS